MSLREQYAPYKPVTTSQSNWRGNEVVARSVELYEENITNFEIYLFHSSRAFCNPRDSTLDNYINSLTLQAYRLSEILYPF